MAKKSRSPARCSRYLNPGKQTTIEYGVLYRY
jgi:hypothetical protein